jgi:hypothetical protein
VAGETINYRFLLRGRTAANWTTLNEILLAKEIGLETDTVWPIGHGRKFKIGDGVTAWNDLEYATPDAGLTLVSGTGIDIDNTDPAHPVISSNLGSIALAGREPDYASLPGAPAAGDAYYVEDDEQIYIADASGDFPLQYEGVYVNAKFNPKTRSYFCTDFVSDSIITSTASGGSFSSSANVVVHTATGGGMTITGNSGKPGILRLIVSSVNGYARAVFTGGLRIVLGGGKQRVKCVFTPSVASDSSQRYSISFGLLDVISGAPTDRITASYQDDINGGNYRVVHYAGGVATNTDLAVGPVFGSVNSIEFRFNAAGTSTDIYVNGVYAGTAACSFTSATAVGFYFGKAVGNTQRTVDLHYVEYEQNYTTPLL